MKFSPYLATGALLLPALSFSLPAGAAETAPVLAGLRKEHPRLMLTDQRLAELKVRHAQDPLLQRYVKDVLAEADRLLDAAVLRHEKPDGIRLLFVSRACLHRVSTLGLAFRWTGDRRYLDAALRDLRAVCAFPDWNPIHFLDTAEMATAVGIGYDWLYNALDEETRAGIREALLRLGLEPGRLAYTEGRYGFPKVDNNWNQVCNFGLTVGALAVADTDPEVAATIVSGAVASLPRAMRHYAPHGAWMEGPAYWGYATIYSCYGIAALDTALGSDQGTSHFPGFSESGFFPLYGTGPTGSYLCYADAHLLARREPQACLFFLAGKFGHAEFADGEHDLLRDRKAGAFHVVWYQPHTDKVWRRDLDRYFAGPVQVALLRSAWEDANALWVGAKAGFNQVAHGHLDLGNFEMDALGVRWALDLGADNYNLPGYWDGRVDGKRWSYYRLNSLSHNVCTLDGKSQSVTGKARLTRWHTGPDAGTAVIDLTSAYPEATRAARGIRLLRREGAVLVQDEFALPEAHDLTWGMTTAAEIRIEDDGSAILQQAGKSLHVRVLAPAGARFEAASAERGKPDAENRGIRRLLLPLKGARGDQRIAVLLAPAGALPPVPQVPVQPLDAWPGEAP